MSFSFNSAGHALATFFKAVGSGASKVVSTIEKIEGTKTIVEGTTAAILGAVAPGAAVPAEGIESAAYAVLGEVVSLIQAGGAAAASKLADAGLDKTVVEAAQTVAAGASQVGTLISAATKK